MTCRYEVAAVDTWEPRGFGFVKFRYPEDAVEAKRHLDCTVIGGREIRIVFAKENRKVLMKCVELHAKVLGEATGDGVDHPPPDADIDLIQLAHLLQQDMPQDVD
ncbi:hypothetical protein CASFOL_006576 [Castilleja foliolosa]|uniref:RRM domain-containing protein n=1 Tax=Castilleja foliolosa TaxID=1961234 RepID=A0ABD3E6R5_9LAMI